jgi:hypothetical protein
MQEVFVKSEFLFDFLPEHYPKLFEIRTFQKNQSTLLLILTLNFSGCTICKILKLLGKKFVVLFLPLGSVGKPIKTPNMVSCYKK